MKQFICVVHDRDGGILNEDEFDIHDSEEAADREGRGWEDDPRYGSHEVEEWEG